MVHFETFKCSYIFLIYVLFALLYHILSPYKISLKKSIKKTYLYKNTKKSSIHIFQFQKFIILILAYICWNFLYNFFLIQVNLWKLAHWWFNGMLKHDILPKIALAQKNDSTYLVIILSLSTSLLSPNNNRNHMFITRSWFAWIFTKYCPTKFSM